LFATATEQQLLCSHSDYHLELMERVPRMERSALQCSSVTAFVTEKYTRLRNLSISEKNCFPSLMLYFTTQANMQAVIEHSIG